MDYGYTVDRVTEAAGVMTLHISDGTRWTIAREMFENTTLPTRKSIEKLAEGHFYHKRALYTQV